MQPVRLTSPAGLSMELNRNGSLRRVDHGEILINSMLGTELEGGWMQLYLRRRHADTGLIESTALLGPGSASTGWRYGTASAHFDGAWKGLRYRLSLVLASSASVWRWHLELANEGTEKVSCDLIYSQDVALAQYGAVRNNEFYVSQYVDFTPLEHPRYGTALAIRQNLAMAGRNPWLLLGSLGHAVGFATDALQFFGLSRRAGDAPPGLTSDLPNQRLQREHSLAVLQEAAFELAPGQTWSGGFFVWFEPHHASASSPADLEIFERLGVVDPPPKMPDPSSEPIDATELSIFSDDHLLRSVDLDEDDFVRIFGSHLTHREDDGGETLSFFTADRRHVVLRAKQLRVLRPHAHILRSGDRLCPEERSLTSNTWMDGIFHSLLTEGHVNINRLLSNPHSYLGLMRAAGQRVFAEVQGTWRLLDVPSAYEVAAHQCRWIYRFFDGDQGSEIHVVSRAGTAEHELGLELEVVAGPARRFLVFHHVAINGDNGAIRTALRWSRDGSTIEIRPAPESDLGQRFPDGFFRIHLRDDARLESVHGDEILFPDGQSRGEPCLVLVLAATRRCCLDVTGHLIESGAGATDATQVRSRSSDKLATAVRLPNAPAAVARIDAILPWFVQNALIHFLSPRGLEQYSGGGWGTRDVCQGPLEMLLAHGEWAAIRHLLNLVFSQQNPDGDWPQWFMFFERERGIRPKDSHGDIVFWPVLAAAEYLLASDDYLFLDQPVRFFDPTDKDRGELAPIREHLTRALALIAERVIPGTSLASYGNGDWNDSLQPLDPSMSPHLCSAWTVTLHYQTCRRLAEAFSRCGLEGEADRLQETAAVVSEEFHRLLMPGGTVTGYAHFHDDRTEYLLHPSDSTTGIHYSLLPMTYGILTDMFTPAEARSHLEQIRAELLAPDGARLFDRPFAYHGGTQRMFQRAESSSFFGREIGIMYMHANLRYAEAMARYGDAEAFFLALQQANPIETRQLVASATLRQSNCYYSSSDAAFADRYQASMEYDRVRQGTVPLEGGWRIYSSGAGIAVRLIIQCFLGIRRGRAQLVIDPVIPKSLDGLQAQLEIAERPVKLVYRIANAGRGPQALRLNGKAMAFEREANPYRPGGAIVSMVDLLSLLGREENTLEVELE